MDRLRIIMTHRIPSDHIIDIEGLPPPFVESLPLQPAVNWINEEKPEHMVEYKTNQWDTLEGYIKRYSKDGRVVEPACVVQTDDRERAKILPPNIKDKQVPQIILDTPTNLLEKPQKVFAPKSYSCPFCEFEGSGQLDIEAHIGSSHGMDVNQMAESGKRTTKSSRIVLYACSSCSFETEIKEDLKAHVSSHEKPANETSSVDLFRCPECDFATDKATKLRGHKMGAHRKKLAEVI